MQQNKQTTGTTRDGFGKALLELGLKNVQVVALCGDLTESMRTHWFKEQFPTRFLQMGVQEENMVGVATGLSLAGKIPFTCSYSTFIVNNALGPIRASVCYTNANVKIIGGHAGITTGPDGATHQALEDIAAMRVLPNMTVIVPSDEEEARQATHAISKHIGPCYLRIGKHKVPTLTKTDYETINNELPQNLSKHAKFDMVLHSQKNKIHTQDSKFKIGKAKIMNKNIEENAEITVVACGNMVSLAVQAADNICAGMGGEKSICIEVINMHTIKPLDIKTLFRSLKKTKALLTIEEHQVAGGLGSAVLEAVATYNPKLLSVPAVTMGIQDSFGQSGNSEELLKKYQLDIPSIEKQIRKIVQLKNENA